MKKTVAALSLMVSCVGALATPVSFTSVSYSTSAFASAGAIFDGPRTDDSPPTALPLSTSATATSAPDSATATATAADLFLSATSQALSVTDLADAGAVATFTGTFVPTGGTLTFAVNFNSQSNGLGAAGNKLEFRLVDGIIFIDEMFTDTAAIVRDFTLPADSFATLDVILISSADALNNDAFSQGSAAISLTVPEPSTRLLYLAGALALALRRPRNQS